jgi:hypothetical protein
LGSLGFGVECGGALLCRFRFSSCFGASTQPAGKQEKPKRRSKAPPHPTPKAKQKSQNTKTSLGSGQ